MALDQGNGSFTGQTESHAFAGFLFDVDGTIINTTDAVTKHWQRSVNSLFSLAHGKVVEHGLLFVQLPRLTA